MTLDPQVVGPICGAVVAVCGAFVSWLRYRVRLAEIRAGLPGDSSKPLSVPGAGAFLALFVGGTLSIGLPVARGQAHPGQLLSRILERPSQVAESPVIAECNEIDCPKGKCVNGKCQQTADKPALLPVPRPKKAKAQRPPVRADASPIPDATLTLPAWAETQPSAFAGRMPEHWGS